MPARPASTREGGREARSPRFLLGLPTLADNGLWRTAARLDAEVLISANALSVWKRDGMGLRRWDRFTTTNLHLVSQRPVCLDSAGFVAAVRYRGFEWSVQDYMHLCAGAPWKWFASMDLCVEEAVAHERDIVLDRISGTVRLNKAYLTEASSNPSRATETPIAAAAPKKLLSCSRICAPLARSGSVSRGKAWGATVTAGSSCACFARCETSSK